MRYMGRVSSGAGYKANAGKRKEEMKNRSTWIPNCLAVDHSDNTDQTGEECVNGRNAANKKPRFEKPG